MTAVINVVVQFFAQLNSMELLGMPLIVWLLLPFIIGIVMKFIVGRKGD